LECLKYAHDNGCEWDIEVTECAALNGHLECLRYAHEQGYKWNYTIPLYAAKNGHLDCLKYAHENGCTWDKITPSFAAYNGHLECFKYCFQVWDDQQIFWNHEHDLSKIMDKIDLDDPLWRKLFNLNLGVNPQLQSKVNAKKQEILEMKEASKDALQNTLPLDIIKYCLQPFF